RPPSRRAAPPRRGARALESPRRPVSRTSSLRAPGERPESGISFTASRYEHTVRGAGGMRTQKHEGWPGSHTVAMVVIDIEDSTGWVVGLGDADWLRLLLDHRRIVRERMAEFGGTELT